MGIVRFRLYIAATVVSMLALARPDASAAATLVVGPRATIQRVADAAKLAKDGDTVEILPGEYRGDVAVWPQRKLTIRGVGKTPVMIANGQSAEGKAIWVIRDGDFIVENVAFEGARVPDGNGAGIRFESGRLVIRDCRFTDNENGVLTSNSPDSELIVQDSLFAHAPRDRGPLKHLLYVGRIARFSLVGTRLHDGFEGHLVKSRARENDIRYNLIYDGKYGEAAYELEFPNGGMAVVVGNVIGQSATTTNPVVVAYGAEGSVWPKNELLLSQNTLTSDRIGAWFLRVWSDRVPADTRVIAVNNLTVGIGVFTLGAKGTFEGNYPALPPMLGDSDVLDFEVVSGSFLHGIDAPAPNVDGVELTPNAEFRLPVGTQPILPRERWTPGAFQSTVVRLP
jgi:hypothetical protein